MWAGCRLLHHRYGHDAVKASLKDTVPEGALDAVAKQQADKIHGRSVQTGGGSMRGHHHGKAQSLPVHAVEAADVGDLLIEQLVEEMPELVDAAQQLYCLDTTLSAAMSSTSSSSSGSLQHRKHNSSSSSGSLQHHKQTSSSSSSGQGNGDDTNNASNASRSSSRPQMHYGSACTLVEKHPLSVDCSQAVFITFGGALLF